MHYTTLLTAVAATLAVAAPTTNSTTLAERGMFEGSIQFFERWDCQDHCVEKDYCLSGQATRGMANAGTENFIGWDSGCWDRPAGVHSLSLSISNGHKYSGISKSCKQYKADNFAADIYPLKSGKKEQCNVLPHNKIKAVVYQW